MKDNVKLHMVQATGFVLAVASLSLSAFTIATKANAEDEIIPSADIFVQESDFESENEMYSIPATESSVYDGPIVYYDITAEDRYVLECIVQGEAGGESLEGKMWVATCLLNAMKREGNASAEYVRVQYQYAGWNANVSDDSIRAVSRVFDDGELMHESVLWFYNPAIAISNWHESQQFVAEIGGHRFFCPKGE